MSFDSILLESIPRYRVIGWSGETGCGKTRGMLSFAAQYPQIVGQVLFITPTQQMLRPLLRLHPFSSTISLMVAQKGLNHLIQNHDCLDTVVVDEAHFYSREYETLIRTLAYFFRSSLGSFRIIFISSTLDYLYLEGIFRERIYNLCGSHNIVLERPFPLEIVYENGMLAPPDGHQRKQFIWKQERVRQLLYDNYKKTHDKIIVFLASHEQCDQWQKLFTLSFSPCLVFYSNMSIEQQRKTERWLHSHQSSFILFTTNILESGITLPHVSMVIDLGVYYVKEGNRITQEWCDQSSMIQRAGRTGRTCPGIVYRLVSENFFTSFPFRNRHRITWDKSVLELKAAGLDPEKILPHEEILPCIENLRQSGLWDKAELYIQSPLGILPTQLLLLVKKKFPVPNPLSLILLLAISVIHFYETSNLSLLSLPEGVSVTPIEMKIKINSAFFREKDELCTILSIFISLFLSRDTKAFSQQFHLHLKTFLTLLRIFQDSIFFVFKEKINWKFHLTPFLEGSPYFRLHRFKEEMSRFLFIYSRYPIRRTSWYFQSTYSSTLKDFFIFDRNCLYSGLVDSGPGSQILILCRKKFLSEPYLVSLFLLPHHFNFFAFDSILKEGIYEYLLRQRFKKKVRGYFVSCSDEIRDLVSLRPPNHGYESFIQEWKNWFHQDWKNFENLLENKYNLEVRFPDSDERR